MQTLPTSPVTVLLPVYNGGPHLPEAVQSVLEQTLADLELLIIDDGSTDGSGDYLDALDDPRVRVLHQPNAGLVATLNRGLQEARHDLVARMDADDLSLPERLTRQVAHLEANPHLLAVGCCFEVMDEAGVVTGEVHTAEAAAYLHRQLHFRNVLPHGGMVFRREAVLAVGGYREVGPVEDYDLWARLSQSGPLDSLPEVLFRYRVTPSGVSQQAAARQRECLAAVRRELRARHPLAAVSARTVAAEGVDHVRRFSQTCRGTAQWYAFDHSWLAVLAARDGDLRTALTYAGGVALFVLRRPRAVLGLPPVMALRAAVRR